LAAGDVLGYGNGCLSTPALNLTAAAAVVNVGTRDPLYAEPGVSTPITAAFYTNQQTIAVTSCAGVVAGQTVLDGTAVVGKVSACPSGGTQLTLTTWAAVGSFGATDTLTFATAMVAQDSWATNMTTIPIAVCPTGALALTSGETVVNGAGVTVGTVGAGLCISAPRLALTQPSGYNSSGVGDTIIAMARRRGDFRFSTVPSPGGSLGWSSVSDAAPTYVPAGLAAFDAGGTTWPVTSAKTTLAALTTLGCGAANAGATAVITNGIAAPTYLQAMGSTTGTSTRKMFCDGTGWVYD
jgi:hypothetical protein